MNPIPTLTKEQLKCFWSKVGKRGPDDCWEWTASFNKGYGSVSLDGVTLRANRVSYAIANGDPGEIYVCHTCDNPACVNPSHLWTGTMPENNADRDQKDRQVKGVKHGRARLTEEQVKAIRESKETQQILAGRYGVVQQIISRIINRKIWRHI